MDVIPEELKVAPKDQFCDGVWVRMGGRRYYLIPALSFRALKKSQPQLAKLNAMLGIPDAEQIDNLIQIAHAAMVRNYPEMKMDELEDLIDMTNFTTVFTALVLASGLEKSKPGEQGAVS